MYFSNIKIHKWQQFESVDINFGEKLTILTGVNGSGKTSILTILARHGDWVEQYFYATPKKDQAFDKLGYVVPSLNRNISSKGKPGKAPSPEIGEIKYSNSHIAKLKTPISTVSVITYPLYIEERQKIKCFLIPLERFTPTNQPIQNIPISLSKNDKNQAFEQCNNSYMMKYADPDQAPRSITFDIKPTLVQWFFEGHELKSSDPEQLRWFKDFERVLKKVLPKSLGFEKIEMRGFEIIFICNNGKDEFPFEAISKGIAALIGIAWQIYTYNPEEDEGFTVIIDEMENHLHPLMQRQVLANLIEAFPSARFIVSTHSPLIVGSVRNANVYALIYDENGKIVSKHLDFEDEAQTTAEILETVFDVSNMPAWMAEEILNSQKPLVFVEGGYDIRYIEKAAEFLNKGNLLSQIEIRPAGGFRALDNIWKCSKWSDPRLEDKKIMLLYDCDTDKSEEDRGNIFKRVIPVIPSNPIRKGIENLFPETTINKVENHNSAFVDIDPERTGRQRGKEITIPKTKSINKDEKRNMCNWLCENGDKGDFSNFKTVFELIEEALSLSVRD